MSKYFCFDLNTYYVIAFSYIIDIFLSLNLIYFAILIEFTEPTIKYLNNTEKIINKILIGILSKLIIFSFVNLIFISNNKFQILSGKCRFFYSHLLLIYSILYFIMQYFVFLDCYRDLTENKSAQLYSLFFSDNIKNHSEIIKLKNLFLIYIVCIFMVVLLFLNGRKFRNLQFNKEEEEEVQVVSTWRRRESLNKELK